MKPLTQIFALATLAHLLFWGKRYVQAPVAEKSWLILLGPARPAVQRLLANH
ncbi:MAG: hypothetical protein Q3965_01010 [Rothia sp. (in: high G+C Gram-positive bacteria)]|nr:hypothetical protein [Rothia sp. (in: high G+C Gram-positive bacteria)]